MQVIEAAKLMEQAYYNIDELQPNEGISLQGVQAHLVDKKRVLIVEGTNELTDWLNYNFDAKLISGDSGAKYHSGFYNYAMIVYSFAKPLRSRFDLIIGHSLGAAAAQIAGPSLNCKTLAFASPRPIISGDLAHSSLVMNICRGDDAVCFLPPGCEFMGLTIGFRHIGAVKWLTRKQEYLGEDHRIQHYIQLLEGEAAEFAKIEV